MKKILMPAVMLTVVLTVLTGLIYPLAVTGLSQLLFRHQANGSLTTVGGKVVGSELIGAATAILATLGMVDEHDDTIEGVGDLVGVRHDGDHALLILILAVQHFRQRVDNDEPRHSLFVPDELDQISGVALLTSQHGRVVDREEVAEIADSWVSVSPCKAPVPHSKLVFGAHVNDRALIDLPAEPIQTVGNVEREIERYEALECLARGHQSDDALRRKYALNKTRFSPFVFIGKQSRCLEALIQPRAARTQRELSIAPVGKPCGRKP